MGKAKESTEEKENNGPQLVGVSMHIRDLRQRIKKAAKKVVAPIEKKQTQAPSETQQTYIADANTDYAPAPIYPKLALRRGLQGQVKLRLGINGNGVPVLIDLIESSGHEILDQAAIFALKKWRFLATTKQEEISFWTEKVIEFQLQ